MKAALTRAQLFRRLAQDLEVTFAIRKPLHRGRSIYGRKWRARSKRYPGSVGTGESRSVALVDLIDAITRGLWWVQPVKATKAQQRQVDAWLAVLNDPAPKGRRAKRS